MSSLVKSSAFVSVRNARKLSVHFNGFADVVRGTYAMTKVTSTSLTHWHDIVRLVNFSFDLLRFFFARRCITSTTSYPSNDTHSFAYTLFSYTKKKKQFQPPEPHLTFGVYQC
jgi:hypothetical protein